MESEGLPRAQGPPCQWGLITFGVFSISPEPGMLGVPEIDLRLREGGDLPKVGNVP